MQLKLGVSEEQLLASAWRGQVMYVCIRREGGKQRRGIGALRFHERETGAHNNKQQWERALAINNTGPGGGSAAQSCEDRTTRDMGGWQEWRKGISEVLQRVLCQAALGSANALSWGGVARG